MTDFRTQMMTAAPHADPNKTMMGGVPSVHATVDATVTIKPVQCPVCKSFNPVGVMFCVDCGLIFDRALEGDAFGAPAVQLPVLVDESGREHPVRPGAVVVGRQGDISFDDTRISRRHAEITTVNGALQIADLGSTNGTKVNGSAIAQGASQPLVQGDEISLGGFKLKLSLPGEVNKTIAPMSGKTQALTVSPTAADAPAAYLVGDDKEFPLAKGVNTFGRRDSNAIQISDPYVSGAHGQLEVTDDGIYLTDTGSTNGTVLNDTKIAANDRIKLLPDDVIRLGSLEFRIRR